MLWNIFQTRFFLREKIFLRRKCLLEKNLCLEKNNSINVTGWKKNVEKQNTTNFNFLSGCVSPKLCFSKIILLQNYASPKLCFSKIMLLQNYASHKLNLMKRIFVNVIFKTCILKIPKNALSNEIDPMLTPNGWHKVRAEFSQSRILVREEFIYEIFPFRRRSCQNRELVFFFEFVWGFLCFFQTRKQLVR